MPPSVPLPTSDTDTGRRLTTASAARSATQRIAASSSANNVKRKATTRRRATASARMPFIGSGGSMKEDSLIDDTNNNTTAVEKDPSLYPNTAGVMGGAGMMPYVGGMYGSPYTYGGMPPMMGMGGPFSGMYQLLFGVQNVVFSLTQAVQLMGTNQHALQQAFDSLTGMIDHAIATFHELRQLEASETARETEEQKRRRRRLKALRWAFVMGTLWLLQKIIRRLTSRPQRRRIGYDGSNNNCNALGLASYHRGNNGSVPYAGGYNTGSGYGTSYGGGYGAGSSYGAMFGGGQYGAGGGYFQ